MIFETDRLILRPWKIEDAEELYKYAKDPRVGPRAGWPVHTNIENSREIIETVFSAEGTFAVILKETNLPIGCIGYMRNANIPTKKDEVELGYWLGKPHWGQGFIPEACKVLIKYCFETLECSRIWAGYYDRNRNSCRVLQKCGFEFHHTEYDKPCELLNEYRTEHIVILTKERWNNMQQDDFMISPSEDDWTVHFEGGFLGDFGWGSEKVPIHKTFQYCDETCVIPYIYLCPEGVVIDYCVGIETKVLDKFLKKWNFSERNEWDDFTQEEAELIEEEHPLMFHYNVDEIQINGVMLRRTNGCSNSYVPDDCQLTKYRHKDTELLPYLERYDLDDKKAWKIERASYSWEDKRLEVIESFKILVKSDKKTFHGIHFTNPKVGDVFTFQYPVTGMEHELNVLAYDEQFLDEKHFSDDEFDYPRHFYAMQYKVNPDISMENMSISDCSQGDSPRYKGTEGNICGAVGVSAITKIEKNKELRSVCSSMHFEPIEHIEWRIAFRAKTAEDAEIELI